jgi:hypothetical protein
MSEQVPAKQLDFDRCTLWGGRLRVLLNSNQISYGEINELLREKGIFLDSTEKSITVPLLSSCLLTPEELGRLISRSYSRESLEKYKTEKVTLISPTVDWHGAILENFEGLVGGINLESGHDFIDRPRVIRHPSGELEIQYKIKKEDYSKDWIEQELHFFGGLIISKRNGELILELQKTHTSKETDRINGILVKALNKQWKDNLISKDQVSESIRFDDFTNEERISFFLYLTGAEKKNLVFDEINDIEIVRYESAGSLPKDPEISWMEGRVKKIKVNGKNLDKLGLLTNKRFHNFCLLVKMSAIYEFRLGAVTGKCSINFWFGGKSSFENDFSNTELNMSIERITRLDKNAEKEVRRGILRNLCDLQDIAMKKILLKRIENQAEVATA